MKKNNKNQIWAVVHVLGSIHRVGTEKEVKLYCKRNQINPKHPIYFAVPLYGVKHIECDKCKGKGSIITTI